MYTLYINMTAVNNEYDDDEEYRAFEDYVDSSNKAGAQNDAQVAQRLATRR